MTIEGVRDSNVTRFKESPLDLVIDLCLGLIGLWRIFPKAKYVMFRETTECAVRLNKNVLILKYIPFSLPKTYN